jgi:hypothetical protein
MAALDIKDRMEAAQGGISGTRPLPSIPDIKVMVGFLKAQCRLVCPREWKQPEGSSLTKTKVEALCKSLEQLCQTCKTTPTTAVSSEDRLMSPPPVASKQLLL